MEEEKKVSKFSSGLNILMRVDQLWKNCASFKRDSKYLRWNEELDTIWLELARDLPEKTDDGKRKTFNEVKTKFDKFDEELSDTGAIKDGLDSSFDRPTILDINNRKKQYTLLKEKQLFLARLENELGKGTSWEDAEDEDF